MTLISTSDLMNRTLGELSAMFYRVTQELPLTRTDSAERRQALAALDTINRTRAVKAATRPSLG